MKRKLLLILAASCVGIATANANIYFRATPTVLPLYESVSPPETDQSQLTLEYDNLPPAYINEPYRSGLPNVGQLSGVVNFTASGLSGTGISIDTSTGLLTGTPLNAGVINATVTATAGVDQVTTSVTITVNPSREKMMMLLGKRIASGTILLPYTFNLGENLHLQNIDIDDVEFGISDIEPGELPPGLSIENGILSGTPSQVGTYEFNLTTKFDNGEELLEDSDFFEIIIRNRNSRNIAVGWHHACGVTEFDTVICWGLNDNGQVGVASPSKVYNTVPVDGVSGVENVATGYYHTCAVLKDGTAKCWGSMTNGKLGNGLTSGKTHIPVTSSVFGSNIVEIGTGREHTCILKVGGSVQCLGENTYGQLGDGTYTSSSTLVTAIPSGAVQLSVGSNSNCVVMEDFTVKCWGMNSRGQLGTGDSINRPSPETIPNLTDVTKVVTMGYIADYGLTCALIADGSAKCWGRNNQGQVGDGLAGAGDRRTPSPVANLTGIVDIAVGVAHACAMVSDGIWCWGHADRNGSGLFTASNVPVRVVNLVEPIKFFAGGDSTCAISAQGTRCWGTNNYGDIGVPNSAGETRIPIDIQ